MFRMTLPSKEEEIEKVAGKIDAMVDQVVDKTLSGLEQQISNRKLYVMFEKQLSCDPTTDHINPKDVLPIFKPFFDRSRAAAKQLNTMGVKDIVREAFTEMMREEMTKRIDAEQLNGVLGGRCEKYKELLELLEKNYRSYMQEMAKIKRQLEVNINMLNEQLLQQQRIGTTYKPDINTINVIQREQTQNGTLEESGIRMRIQEGNNSIQSFQQKIQRLTEQNQLVLSQMKDLAGYKDQYERLLSEHNALKDSFANEKQQRGVLEAQLEEMKQRAQAAEFQRDQQAEEIKCLQARLRELDKQQGNSRSAAASGELEAARAELERLRRQNEQLKEATKDSGPRKAGDPALGKAFLVGGADEALQLGVTGTKELRSSRQSTKRATEPHNAADDKNASLLEQLRDAKAELDALRTAAAQRSDVSTQTDNCSVDNISHGFADNPAKDGYVDSSVGTTDTIGCGGPDADDQKDDLDGVYDLEQLRALCREYRSTIASMEAQHKALSDRIAELEALLAAREAPLDLDNNPLVQQYIDSVVRMRTQTGGELEALEDQLRQVECAQDAVIDLQNNLDSPNHIKRPKQQLVHNISNNFDQFAQMVEDTIGRADRANYDAEHMIGTVGPQSDHADLQKDQLCQDNVSGQKHGEGSSASGRRGIQLLKDYDTDFINRQLNRMGQDSTASGSGGMSKEQVLMAMKKSIMEEYYNERFGSSKDEIMTISKYHTKLNQLSKRLQQKIEEQKSRIKVYQNEMYIRYLASMRYLNKEAMDAYRHKQKGYFNKKQDEETELAVRRIEAQFANQGDKVVDLQVVNMQAQSEQELGFRLSSINNRLVFSENNEASHDQELLQLGQSKTLRAKNMHDVRQVSVKMSGVNMSPQIKLPDILRVGTKKKRQTSGPVGGIQKERLQLMSYLDDLTNQQEQRGRELIRIKADEGEK